MKNHELTELWFFSHINQENIESLTKTDEGYFQSKMFCGVFTKHVLKV